MGLPKKIQGSYFTEIVHDLIPEISMSTLVRLGALIRQRDRGEMYRPLADSLRKIQWVKFVGLRAIFIEREITEMIEPNSVVMFPLGQIDHSLSITDCVIHTKSAIDLMAVFLTSFLNIKATGGERDLKKEEFRKIVSKNDKILGRKIEQLEPWLIHLQNIRDEWIHRSSYRSVLIIGPSEVGVLPIPRTPSKEGKLTPDKKINRRNYLSTEKYVKYHYSKLIDLFQSITRRCIHIEETLMDAPLEIPDKAEERMTFFPTQVTKKMTLKKMKVKLGSIEHYFTKK